MRQVPALLQFTILLAVLPARYGAQAATRVSQHGLKLHLSWLDDSRRGSLGDWEEAFRLVDTDGDGLISFRGVQPLFLERFLLEHDRILREMDDEERKQHWEQVHKAAKGGQAVHDEHHHHWALSPLEERHVEEEARRFVQQLAPELFQRMTFAEFRDAMHAYIETKTAERAALLGVARHAV